MGLEMADAARSASPQSRLCGAVLGKAVSRGGALGGCAGWHSEEWGAAGTPHKCWGSAGLPA